MKVVQVAQIAKPDGEFVEIFNRDRSLTYAQSLKVRGMAAPGSGIATELGETFVDPVTDGMFWSDIPLASLVSGMVPSRVIGLDGTTFSQGVSGAIGNYQVPIEPRATPRAITFECLIAGATCCAVAQYKRRFDQWLTDGLSCAGLTMKVLLNVSSSVVVCDDPPVAQDAEWFILKNVSVTQALRTTNAIPQDACKCGSTCLDVVRFTFTAGDPHLYRIESGLIADEAFAGGDLSDNTAEYNEQFATEATPVTLPKRALPLNLKLDGTACPIGWNISDYPTIGTNGYLTVTEKESPPPFVPYRVSLRVYEDYSTEFAKINPSRWPSDNSIPCDDIVAADIEYPNPFYDPTCDSCAPGLQAALCAQDQGLVVNEFGIIDWDASGIDPGIEHVWTPGGGASPELQRLLLYWKCLGVTAASETAGPHGEGLTERAIWDLAGYFNDADHDDAIYSPDGSSSIPFSVDAVSVIIQDPSLGGAVIRVGEELTPGTVTIVNTSYRVRVDSFLGYDGDNPLFVITPPCGPGDAEYVGQINEPYLSPIGTKLDLSAFYATDGSDFIEYSVPDLTPTVLSAVPTSAGTGLAAAIYHPVLDKIWSILRKPSAPGHFEVYEDGVLIDTKPCLDWGFDPAPFWDISNGRMLMIIGGINNNPKSRADVRDDMVVVEWAAGAVWTEIDSWPIPLHPTPSITVEPLPFHAVATPNGGAFFAGDIVADKPTTSNNDSMNYWSPTTGFVFGIGRVWLDASGSPTGEGLPIYYGYGNHGMAPDGTIVWFDEDSPMNAYKLNENEVDVVTPTNTPETLNDSVCSGPDPAHADAYESYAMPGAGFTRGLAMVQLYDGASGYQDVYLLDHSVPNNSTCGNSDLTHCQPTAIFQLNTAVPTGEAFPIELQTDGTWLHPTWNFLRDGIPPEHATVKIQRPDDCETVCYDTRDAAIDVTVGGTEILWTPDSWAFDPEKGIPGEYTVVVNGQAPGTYADSRTTRIVKTVPDADTLDDILFPQASAYTLVDPQTVPDWVLQLTPTSIAQTIDRFPSPASSGRHVTPRIVVESGPSALPFFRVRLLAGEDLTVYTVGDVTDEAADAGFIVVGLPADSSFEFDVSLRRATVTARGVTQDASPLLRGLFNEPIDWENFVFTDERDIVVVVGVDASSVGSATWSMWAQEREVG